MKIIKRKSRWIYTDGINVKNFLKEILDKVIAKDPNSSDINLN